VTRDRWLARHVTDRIEPVLHHVALLLRHDAAYFQGAELGDRLYAEVVGRHRRGDEARGRRLKGHVARFHAGAGFRLQSLVPHVEVVVGVELALAVEVPRPGAAVVPPPRRCVSHIADWE